MSIVYVPPSLQLNEPTACAICRVNMLFNKASAGLIDANNRQAFACVSHFSEVELLIVGWADFIARERLAYLQKDQITSDFIYGGGDARLNS